MAKYKLNFLNCLLLAYTFYGKGFAQETTGITHLKLDRETCLTLMVNMPADENAAYQPGVDAEGNAVIAADIEGSNKIAPPQEIQIPIRLDLSTYLDSNTIHTPVAKVGKIKRMQDGRLYFNDQPLFHEDQAQVIEVCKKILANP